MNDWTFADELTRTPINLPRTALRFAQSIAYPQLNVTNYMVSLTQLVDMAQTAVSPDVPIQHQAEQLARFLFEQEGFSGNSDQYNDPNNSYLNQVLDRHLGIPISLSVIYIYVAQKIGLPAYGIALPGHFIVGVKTKHRACFLDPFHAGIRLSYGDCSQLVQQTTGYTGPFKRKWLQPTPPRAILARMLNNLRLVYIGQGQWQTAITVMEHLCLVQPTVQEHIRDLGLVHYRQGNFRLAAAYLERYAQANPHNPDVTTLKRGLHNALKKWVASN